MDDKLMESLINSDELITKTIEENNNSFKDLFDQFSSIMSMTIVNGEQIEKQLTEQGEKEAEQIKGALTGNISQASNLTLEKVAESEIQENQGSILSDETVNDLINVIANIQDVLGKINTDQIATITATSPESANANTGINKELIISNESQVDSIPQVGPEAPTPQVNPELTLAQVGPSLPLPQVGPEAPTPQVNPELTLAQVGPSLPLPQVGPEAPTPATNTLNIENLGQVIDDFKTLSNLNWCTDWLKCLEKIIEQADIVKEALNAIPFEKKISLGLNDEELGKLDESIQKVKENISSDINLSTAKNELIEQTVSSNTPDLSTSFLDSFFDLSEKLGLFTDKVENNSISQESFINKVSEFSETTSKTIENTFTTFNDTTKTILEKPNTLETALETIESKVQTEAKPEFLSEFSFEELLNFTIPKFTEVNAQEFLPPPPPPLIPFEEMGMIPSLIKSFSPETGTVQNITAPAINLPNEELINIEGVQPEITTTLTSPPLAPPPPLEFGFESILESLGFSFPGILPEAEGVQVVNTESPTASLSPLPMGPELQQAETANVVSPKTPNVPAPPPPPPLEFGFESIFESLGFSFPGILPEAEGVQVVNTESPTASLSPMPMGPELQQVETANVGSPKVSNVPAPPPPMEFGFESILESLGFSSPGIFPEAEGIQVVNTESPTASLSPMPMGPELQQAETANVGSPKVSNIPAPPPPMDFMDFLFPKSPVVEEPLGTQVNTVEKNPLNLENLFNFESNVLSDNTIKETGISLNEIQKPLGFEELGSLDITNNSKTTENMGNQFSAKPLPFAPDFNLMSSFPEIETFGEMTLENVQNITEPIYNPLESLFQTKGNEFSKNNVAVGNTKASPPAISNNIEEMLIKNQEIPQVNLSTVATKIQNEIPQSTSELAASTEVMMNEVNLEPLGSQLSSSIDSLSQNMNTQPADAQAATGAAPTESSPDVMNQILTMLTNLNSTIKGMSSSQGAGTTVIPQSGGSSLSEAQARIIGRQIANELKDNFSKLYN